MAQHRLFVLLITAFAVFEWAAQTEPLPVARAGLVFPLVCSVGGALLMTHSHFSSNIKEEFLAELSLPPAILVCWRAGQAGSRSGSRNGMPAVVAWIWPVCFVLIGSMLLVYREA